MARVLVVDDEPDVRELLCEEIDLLGYSTISAASGRQALEKLASEAVDVVVSDVRMPDGDGLFLLKELRAKFRIPVILISGFTDLTPASGFDLGAVAVLAKPYDHKKLALALEEAMHRKAS